MVDLCVATTQVIGYTVVSGIGMVCILIVCRSCPQCDIVSGGERNGKQPLHPIPVQRPFQILGLDIMDLPATEQSNKHVVVLQEYITKWLMVFPVPDQKTLRIVDEGSDSILWCSRSSVDR